MKWRAKTSRRRRENMKKSAFLGLSILLALFWISSGVAAEKNEIILGYSAPVSGGMSHVGEKIRQGYTIWSEMVNEKGGIFVKEVGKKLRVKLIMYDDKSDPTTSAKLYEKLITQDKVDLVLSPYGSSIGFPVSGICQKYKMPIVFVWVSSGPIYKQGYDHAFCLIEPSERHLWTPVRLLKDTRVVSDPPKKLIFIASKELYDITAAKGGMDLAKEVGFETFYEEVEKGVKDFTPIISRAKTQGIDGLIAALYPAEFFLLFRQMQELGYRPRYINGLHGPDLPDFWETFGKTANGVVTGGYYSAKWPSFENKEYVERYQKKWGEIPTHYGATGAGGQILHQAIEKAGTLNPEKVREVLLKDEFKCLLYPRVKFVSEAGYTNINKHAFTGVLQWEDGKLLTVFPPELAEAKLKYPLPPKW
jgi:branched-chain amino acid transport system substrate-binding protein